MAKRIVIGASETAAIFGVHPYMTAFELWGIKAGVIPREPFASKEQNFWGLKYERGTAEGYCEMYNRRLVTLEETFCVAEDMPELVANLDFMHAPIEGEADAVLECKMVDYLRYMEKFPGGDLPLNFELQLQQQMHCKQVSRGTCAVVVNGNTLYPFERDYRAGVMKRVKETVAEFLESIKAGQPPSPDFMRDAAAISRKFRQDDGTIIKMPGNNYLDNLCVAYNEAAAQESEIGAKRKAIRAELMEEIGRAREAHTSRFIITASTVSEAEIAYTRKPYRNINIRERN